MNVGIIIRYYLEINKKAPSWAIQQGFALDKDSGQALGSNYNCGIG